MGDINLLKWHTGGALSKVYIWIYGPFIWANVLAVCQTDVSGRHDVPKMHPFELLGLPVCIGYNAHL